MARLLRQRAATMLARESTTLSPEQWILLWRVYERGPCSQRSLADPVLDDRANITRMIDRLEAERWLARTPDPEDARRKLVALTAAGRTRFEALFDAVVQTRVALFGDIAARDFAAFERVLAQLESRLSGEG